MMNRPVWWRLAFAILLWVGSCPAWGDPQDRAPTGAELARALSLPEGIAKTPALRAKIADGIARLDEPSPASSELLELAYLFHANGYEAQAIVLYDHLIAASDEGEERARLRYLAADAVAQKGDSVAARAYLEAAASDWADYPLALARLGEARYKASDFAGAEEAFAAALSLAGDLSMARLGLARLFERDGRSDEAIQQLEALLASDPDNYNAQALLVRALNRTGKEEEALALARAFSASSTPPVDDPWFEPVRAALYDPQRLDFLFLDYFKAGDCDQALSYLERLEEIDPQEARYKRYRATVLLKLEKRDEAIATIRTGLQLSGDEAELRPLLIQALKLAGRWEEAELEARKALREAGPSAALLLELGRLLVEQEKWSQALEPLEAALAMDPYQVEVHLLRARAGFWTDRDAEAEESLAMVRQLAPSDAVILYRAALLYMEAGRFPAALPLLDQALQAKPHYEEAIELQADAHFELAQLARQRKQPDQALSHLKTALRLWPSHVNARTALAQLLMELEKFPEAEVALRDLLAARGPEPILLLYYGDALYRNGKPDAARAAWRQGMEQLGEDSDVAPLRRLLRLRLERASRGASPQ